MISRAGFTLVELMVVFAIIAIVSVVVITNQGTFNKTLILTNTAYDIALALRSAQTYGLGSRAAFTTSVSAGYGIHFDGTPSDRFVFFADTYPAPSSSSVCHPIADPTAPNAKAGNCSYDQNQGEMITTSTLGNGMTISGLCAFVQSSWTCGLTSLDIVFSRPNPNPFISLNGQYSANASTACLVVMSPQGSTRYVSVSASGQVNANATSCP